jgi:hypothetical protein
MHSVHTFHLYFSKIHSNNILRSIQRFSESLYYISIKMYKVYCRYTMPACNIQTNYVIPIYMHRIMWLHEIMDSLSQHYPHPCDTVESAQYQFSRNYSVQPWKLLIKWTGFSTLCLTLTEENIIKCWETRVQHRNGIMNRH